MQTFIHHMSAEEQLDFKTNPRRERSYLLFLADFFPKAFMGTPHFPYFSFSFSFPRRLTVCVP
jgi:hypothetical protein